MLPHLTSGHASSLLAVHQRANRQPQLFLFVPLNQQTLYTKTLTMAKFGLCLTELQPTALQTPRAIATQMPMHCCDFLPDKASTI